MAATTGSSASASSSAGSNERLPENIAVMGLGVIGAFTALAILQRVPQAHVTVYEVRPAPATIGGALNISPNCHRCMDKLGVAPSRYGGLTPWVLFQNELGQRVGEFKYGGLGDRWAGGYEGMRAQRNDIQDDLITALRPFEDSGRLKIKFDKRAVSIDESHATVEITFKDGEVSKHDLLVGADGIHSFTRGQIVRLQSINGCSTAAPSPHASEKTPLIKVEDGAGTLANPKATYSGITTIYGLVPASSIPPELLAPLDSHQSIRTISPHAGLLAIAYAKADRSTVHWFSSRSPEIAPSPDVPEPSPNEVRNELLETYGGYPEPIPSLIKATEKIFYWPVFRLLPLPEALYSPAGRIVLVGDSAHALPPFAAQGVGLGVEDALVVTNIIAALCSQSSSHPYVSPSPKLWQREYQDKRAGRVRQYVAHAEAQGRARMSSHTVIGRAREWMLWAAFPLINTLAWVHGSSMGGLISKGLQSIGLGDVQGWGYDPDAEIVSLSGL
ncbi:FAD/NAD(P)-binding domain-containing protein [Clavulina sp. PMI_390]|nr:FAD/NAD(P)-binding domain-containing protein [Clavulina sp. PMI_390]